MKVPLRFASVGAATPAFSAAVVAIAGFLALAWGFSTGRVALVSVLSSLQSGVSVLLVALLTRKSPGAAQIAGLALVTLGLGSIHAFRNS
ncbi:hypothetical protein C7I55_02785 [Sphingomonas deserti]|uniref:EamA domain-containing protein n=1 Tax=Allosphingosinicella deserti TaxID=2116704 RepID=A0A2P7QZC6_9SPHN|nr:hypothetical protein C7I55_02785 [Sphingomonas deserti]